MTEEMFAAGKRSTFFLERLTVTTPPGVSTSSWLGNLAQTFSVSVVVWTVLSVMNTLPGWA